MRIVYQVALAGLLIISTQLMSFCGNERQADEEVNVEHRNEEVNVEHRNEEVNVEHRDEEAYPQKKLPPCTTPETPRLTLQEAITLHWDPLAEDIPGVERPPRLVGIDITAIQSKRVIVAPNDKFKSHHASFLGNFFAGLEALGWTVLYVNDYNNSQAQEADIVGFFLGGPSDLELWDKHLPQHTVRFLVTEDMHTPVDIDAAIYAADHFDAIFSKYPEATLKAVAPRAPLMYPFFQGATDNFVRSLTCPPRLNKLLISGAAVLPFYPLRHEAVELMEAGEQRLARRRNPRKQDPGEEAIDYANHIAEYTMSLAGTAPSGPVFHPYIIGKHVEIPAAGSVVVTDHFLIPYLAKMGFYEGEHFIAASLGELPTVLDKWLAPHNRTKLEMIRRNAHELVLKQHLATHRLAMLHRTALALMLSKQQ